MILYHGYPVQVFDAYTADGYVLRLHRIPFGKNGNFTHRDPNSPVIYLQHGLLGSSGDWVENLPNESFDFFFKIILNVSLILSFILADAGFDVWLGNSRGNSYSIRHVNYSIDDELFWKFSWYEMAKYDLDATFDLILKETGQDSLYYVGFSQGTLIMFTKLADDPIFATKIRKFFALGPIGTVAHVRGLLQILATRIFRDKRVAIHFFGTKYFMLNSKLSKILSILICGTRFFNPLCSSILFQLSGPESNQFNESRLPVYVAGEGGTSVMNILHWIQMVNSGKLQAYSYDSVKENQKYYGQDSAPIYDLSSINASIYLFWSKEDWLANPIDIQVGD
uniref:Partial AB-hydrolase lipase domain-containing protein n=1 Tax=Setaria digitata TaxID=48799 RepID=A0A915PN98_9BILA